ncbi:hypothetical protein CALVIDRAFT_415456 [Calocera viscosa TUFC12733]|uniref:Uncharacterized protein n=1 Tax=Calocera viscosa (strain TUFC12733) TaxID=1330018 RepID=A0A167G1F5_CALVF|nr:hypothetical protein CALVIDRAFT_415456 [Calocera viscosa TUFC12733]
MVRGRHRVGLTRWYTYGNLAIRNPYMESRQPSNWFRRDTTQAPVELARQMTAWIKSRNPFQDEQVFTYVTPQPVAERFSTPWEAESSPPRAPGSTAAHWPWIRLYLTARRHLRSVTGDRPLSTQRPIAAPS